MFDLPSRLVILCIGPFPQCNGVERAERVEVIYARIVHENEKIRFRPQE